MSERSPYPAIPEPGDDPRSMLLTLRAMKEAIEVLTGQRGDGSYKSLSETDADLIRTRVQTTVLLAEGFDGELEAQASAVQSLQSEVSVLDGQLTAQASQVTDLNARVADVDGELEAQASAVQSLQAIATALDGQLTAQASQVTDLNARVGDVDANGYFKVSAAATPTASSATVEARVKAGTGGSFTSAGLKMTADGSGGRVEIEANRFQIKDGDKVPFLVVGGVVYINNAAVRTESIQANAVTQSTGMYTGGNSPDPTENEGYAVIQAIAINRTAGTNLLITAQWQATEEGNVTDNQRTRPFRILRNGVQIHARELSIPVIRATTSPDRFRVHGLMSASFIDTDNSISGNQTYSVEFKHVTKSVADMSTGGTIQVSQPVNQRYVSLTEFKR